MRLFGPWWNTGVNRHVISDVEALVKLTSFVDFSVLVDSELNNLIELSEISDSEIVAHHFTGVERAATHRLVVELQNIPNIDKLSLIDTALDLSFILN